MASQSMVMAPIIAALVKSEDVLGRDRRWRAVNQKQEKFLADLFFARNQLYKFSERELRSWISFTAAELNKILKDEGFDIRLDNFAPDEFGVVSILDVLVKWLVKGKKSEILSAGTVYPAVRMEPSVIIGSNPLQCFEILISPDHNRPIAGLFTAGEEKVFITVAAGEYRGFELIEKIERVYRSMRTVPHSFDFLKFPMVDLSHQNDIGWLPGIWTTGEDGRRFQVSQAQQQTKLKMNPDGARVKSAVAVSFRTTCCRRDEGLVIDEPFLLWIERKSLPFSIAYFYIDKDDWKDPGSLDM